MTNNLGAPQVADNQDQKEQTINDAVGRVDAALTDVLVCTFVGGVNAIVVTSADIKKAIQIDCQPDGGTAPDGACTLTLPSIRRGVIVVTNGTGETLTVTMAAQGLTPGTLGDGDIGLFFMDGTNARPM